MSPKPPCPEKPPFAIVSGVADRFASIRLRSSGPGSILGIAPSRDHDAPAVLSELRALSGGHPETNRNEPGSQTSPML